MPEFDRFLGSLLDKDAYDAALEILKYIRNNPETDHYLAEAAREILDTKTNPAKFEALIFGLGVSYQRWVTVSQLRRA